MIGGLEGRPWVEGLLAMVQKVFGERLPGEDKAKPV